MVRWGVVMMIGMLLVAVLAQVPTPTPGVPAGFTIERFEWAGEIDRGAAVTVRNDFGDVLVKRAVGQRAEVIGTIQREEGDPDRPEVKVDPGKAGLAVTVVCPVGAAGTAGRVRRADLVVLVPAGSPLTARTDRGAIQARNLDSDLDLQTGSGEIFAFTTGSIRARSERGPITARFRRSSWKSEPRFETVTGDIEILLPPDASTVVEASTRGHITTDYSIEIRPVAGSQLKQAKATIGSGHGRLVATSYQGAIRLLRAAL